MKALIDIIKDILALRCSILNFNVFIALPFTIVWFGLLLMGVIS